MMENPLDPENKVGNNFLELKVNSFHAPEIQIQCFG